MQPKTRLSRLRPAMTGGAFREDCLNVSITCLEVRPAAVNDREKFLAGRGIGPEHAEDR